MEDEALITAILKSKSLYEVLQLSPQSTKQEIAKQFKRLSIRVHPDKCRHPKAEEAFKRLNEAHRILTNDRLRQQYDLSGSTREYPPPPPHGFSYRGPRYYANMDDFFFFAETGRAHHAFYRAQRDWGRQRADSDHADNLFSALAPMVLMFFFLCVIPLLPQVISSLRASWNTNQFSFTKSPEFNLEHKTHLGNVKYYVNEHFDANIFLDDDSRKAFENDVLKQWENVLETKCALERMQRDKMMATNHLRMANTGTPSCSEKARISQLRR